MLPATTTVGATTQGTTFADIIINNVNSVAEGAIQGFAQFVHDPKALKDTVSLFAKASAPRKFADAVVLRRIETQKLDDIWQFPLNMSCPTTAPTPWTVVEATLRSQMALTEFEFNIMRTVDFVGRNYVRIMLPEVNTQAVTYSETKITNGKAVRCLGAWHRDLVPRMIEKVEFYPRSNAHKLFEYTGYDIFVHNILFGNAHKEMNDLMAGEDKFELCYDPYRVDASALGISSIQGTTQNGPDGAKRLVINNGPFRGISVLAPSGSTDFGSAGSAGSLKLLDEIARRLHVASGAEYWDTIKDHITAETAQVITGFKLDTTMDQNEFDYVYRHNVWYEAPVAKPYHARHSIHSRRFYHERRDITIPLDILPFGYSIGSSLPSAALSGECGFIRVKLFSDWFDRSFYLTPTNQISSRPTQYILQGGVSRVDPRTEDGTTEAAKDIFSTVWGGSSDSADNKWVQVGDAFVDTDTTGNVTGQVLSEFTSQKDTAASKLSTVLVKPSVADSTHFKTYTDKLNVKLLQVGYQTLPCIREFLSKLPNIYITTEWDDKDYSISDVSSFDINNDLYIQGIVLWFLPVDENGVENTRMYPCHTIDHELPPIAGLELVNEQSQGTTLYDWSMLNVFNPAQMSLNPLIENMGLVSFSPTLTANTLPLAYYDSNINGYLKARIKQGESNNVRVGGIKSYVNMRNGRLKVISIGINGVASVNLNLFRLIF